MSISTLKDRVMVKFIVGDRACDIHPADRIDQLSCQRWNVSVPDQTEYIPVVSLGDKVTHRGHTEEGNVEEKEAFPVAQISFKVHYPVVINKLGVLKALLKENTEVTVALHDGPSQIEIVKAVITSDDKESENDGYIYNTVDPYVLPKTVALRYEGGESTKVKTCFEDFEGFILGKYNNEYGSLGIQNSTYGYNEGGGTISVVKVEAVVSGHYRNPRELILDKVPGVSFVYSIHEPDSLRKHISQTTQRDNHWMSSLIDKELKLREEIEENDDILLVDTIDVYQNIPQKLLIFHQWALESINFKYLLKTDDDCYLDLEKILDILEKYRDKKKIWWGRFRHNWAVDLYGKWAEHSYRSTIYPTFACGSGNILSKDLVQWTVSNIYDLYLFQGEDVSLGIWLAAVNPHIIDDPLWQCESECISGMYSLPDLNAQHLRYYWNNKLQCSDPCGCD